MKSQEAHAQPGQNGHVTKLMPDLVDAAGRYARETAREPALLVGTQTAAVQRQKM